jgi:SRSO17 transposase
LHHFVTTAPWDAAPWDAAPVDARLAVAAQRLVGGPDAVLIVDDTTLPKKGTHSVGVAHQYSGAHGKQPPCQTLVSLTLARREVPVSLALRPFLPKAWTDDAARCRRAGVPEARLAHRTKWQLARDEVDRVRAAGVTFGCVLADAGYGMVAAFRQALSARGLTWAVGVLRT